MNMPKNHKKYWTPNDERKLKSLITGKKTSYEIAILLGRTQTAVIGKIKDLKPK
jgi:hypothetical protein